MSENESSLGFDGISNRELKALDLIVEIKGTLREAGDQPIKIDLNIKPKKEDIDKYLLVVCIHGTFGSGAGSKDVEQAFADTDISVARLTSSRHGIDETVSAGMGKNEQRKIVFGGKTFEMESEDTRLAIDYLINNSEQLFGVKKEKLKLDLVGTSMGAAIAAQMTEEFPEFIEKVVLTAPAIEVPPQLREIGESLLDTFPKKERILDPLSNFTGDVTLIRGSDDLLVSEDDVNKYAEAVRQSGAKLTRITIPGDHKFGKDVVGMEEQRHNYAEEVKKAILK